MKIDRNSPEEFAVFMKDENGKWAKVIKEVGVAMEQHPPRDGRK